LRRPLSRRLSNSDGSAIASAHFMTIGEAAQAMNTSPQTVRAWIGRGAPVVSRWTSLNDKLQPHDVRCRAAAIARYSVHTALSRRKSEPLVRCDVDRQPPARWGARDVRGSRAPRRAALRSASCDRSRFADHRRSARERNGPANDNEGDRLLVDEGNDAGHHVDACAR